MTSTEIVSSPTSEQKRFAAAYLASTADELISAVTGLSPSQSAFRREPGEWSIVQVVEHLAIIEGRVHALISRLPEAAHADPDRNEEQIDEFIVQMLPRRTSRLQAPEAALPKGKCTLSQAIEEFARKRGKTAGLLETCSCLRGRVLPHPIFVLWDGYQWILATASHTARHLAQIREIQAAAAFPNSPLSTEIQGTRPLCVTCS
jgi:DinB superfamily